MSPPFASTFGGILHDSLLQVPFGVLASDLVAARRLHSLEPPAVTEADSDPV